MKYFLVLPYIFHINFGKGVGSHFQFRIHLCQYMSGRLFHAVKISILIGCLSTNQIIIFWHFSFIKFKSFSTTTLITAKSIRAGVMTCSTMGSALINIITFKRDLIIFCSRFATAIIWTSCIDACCIFGTYWTACAFVYILVALILRIDQTKSVLFLKSMSERVGSDIETL